MKPFSSGLELREAYCNCGLISCLVSKLRETSSPGIEIRAFTPDFDHPMFFSWSQRNRHVKFGANRYTPSRAMSKKTNINTHIFNLIYNMGLSTPKATFLQTDLAERELMSCRKPKYVRSAYGQSKPTV